MGNVLAGTVEVLLQASTAQFHNAMTRVRADAKQSAQQLGSDFKRAGLGVALLGAASVKMAAQFDRGLGEVASLMDGVTNKDIKSMGEELKKLSITASQSLESLTKAKYDIVSAGFTNAADSAILLEQAAKLATATVSDAGTTGAVLTKVLNAYGKSASEAASVTDILAVTIKKGQTTMRELGPTIGQVIPTAAELGIGLDELSAGIATLTAAAGQQTPEAMTALNAAMVSFLKPSEQMIQVLNSIGFESGRALLKAKGFGGGLKALEQAASDLNTDIADVFPNIRAMRAAFPLAGKQADIFAENLEAARNSAGTMGKMFKTVADRDSFKLDQAMQSLKVTMVDLGSIILPAVAKQAKEVAKALRENKGAVDSLGKLLKFAAENIDLMAKAWVGLKLVQVASNIIKVAAAMRTLQFAINPIGATLAAIALGFIAIREAAKKGAEAPKFDFDVTNLHDVEQNISLITFKIHQLERSMMNADGTTNKYNELAIKGYKGQLTQLQAIKASLTAVAGIPTPGTPGGSGTPDPGGSGGNVDTSKKVEALDKLKAAAAAANVQLQVAADRYAKGEITLNAFGVAAQAAANATQSLEEGQALANRALAASALEGLIAEWGTYADVVTEAGMLLNTVDLFPTTEAEEFAATLETKVIAAITGLQGAFEVAGQFAQAFTDISGSLIEMEVDKVRTAAADKEAATREGAEAELAAIESALSRGTISSSQAAAQRTAINTKLSNDLDTIRDKAAADESAARKKQKPFLIAQAIANTALAVIKALASAPPPFNFALAGLVGAAGAAQVAQISSQQFQTGTSIVPGTGVGDIVEARLEPGEAVLNKEAVRNIGISEIDTINRGAGSGSKAINIQFSVVTLDAESFETYLNTTGREALIRVVDDIAARGAGGLNT